MLNLNCMKRFSETYDENSLKNTEQPLCTDLLLTDRPKVPKIHLL